MTISSLQQYCKSQSNRKGTVVDFDLIVAYVIFISLILLFVNYSLKMTAPFATGAHSIEKEESTITVKDMIKNKFNVNNLDSICEINYTRLRRLAVTYKIKGFVMPFTDSMHRGEVSFVRKGDELRVITNTSEQENITIKIILPQSASVTNISLESNDSFNIGYDSLSNLVVTLDSKTGNNDEDEIRIRPVNGIVMFSIEGANLSDCYVGNIPLSNYCGTKGVLGPHTSFQRYGLMSDGRTDYYVELTGDAWWTS